jgi:hypothetical protein
VVGTFGFRGIFTPARVVARGNAGPGMGYIFQYAVHNVKIGGPKTCQVQNEKSVLVQNRGPLDALYSSC